MKEDILQDEDSSGIDFIFVGLVGIACIFIGAWIGNAINADILNKAGYDPKQLMADYYRSLAADQQKDAKSASLDA